MVDKHVGENHLDVFHFDKNFAIKTLITGLGISLSRCKYYRKDDSSEMDELLPANGLKGKRKSQRALEANPGCIS